MFYPHSLLAHNSDPPPPCYRRKSDPRDQWALRAEPSTPTPSYRRCDARQAWGQRRTPNRREPPKAARGGKAARPGPAPPARRAREAAPPWLMLWGAVCELTGGPRGRGAPGRAFAERAPGLAAAQHLSEAQISPEEERGRHCGSFQEGDKDACVLCRSAASRKCPFVFFPLLSHFKWNRVNVCLQCSQLHRSPYTSCCRFNEASFSQRVWEQNVFNDLSEQTLSSSNISLN